MANWFSFDLKKKRSWENRTKQDFFIENAPVGHPLESEPAKFLSKIDQIAGNIFQRPREKKPTKSAEKSCFGFQSHHRRPEGDNDGIGKQKTKNRICLYCTETREQCRRKWWIISGRCPHKKTCFLHSARERGFLTQYKKTCFSHTS